MDPRVRRFVPVLCCLLLGTACRRQEATNEPLSSEDPPKRAAASFVHCVEAQAAGCVQRTEVSGGADALLVLSWLAQGSPLSILASLGKVIADHGNSSTVQTAFVNTVERYASAIRGAECDPHSARPAAEVAKTLAATARKRLETLGLNSAETNAVIDELAREVEEELGGGHVVTMQCRLDPFVLHVVTRQRGQVHEVVGLSTTLAGIGEPLTAEQVEGRLRGQSLGLSETGSAVLEGTIHPYLPFSQEVL